MPHRGFVVNATILLPLLGITWVVGLFAINENTLAFAYAFTILNSLQVNTAGVLKILHLHFNLGSIYIRLSCCKK